MIITKENLFFFLPKDRQIVDTITGKHKEIAEVINDFEDK